MFGELNFLFVKIFLTKLSSYHDNYCKYFMFGKYNGFVCKAKGFCMHDACIDLHIILKVLPNEIIKKYVAISL
jgi:hypothetical protein